MEADSEKRKRGRPPVFPPQEMALVRRFYQDVTTDRQRREIVYSLRALAVLKSNRRFRWLCDPEAMEAGKLHSWRPGILARLGRIDDPDLMRSFAARICKLRPRTKDARQVIDGWLSIWAIRQVDDGT